MRVVPRKSDPSMFRDASRRRFACFADQILSLDLPSSSDMHTSPTTLSARRKCDQKQADRVTDQVEDSPPRVVVLFVSGTLVPDFRAVDIRSVSISLRQTSFFDTAQSRAQPPVPWRHTVERANRKVGGTNPKGQTNPKSSQ